MDMWQNYFYNRNSITKEINKWDNVNFKQILRFSWQQQIQNKKFLKYYTEKDKTKSGVNFHC